MTREEELIRLLVRESIKDQLEEGLGDTLKNAVSKAKDVVSKATTTTHGIGDKNQKPTPQETAGAKSKLAQLQSTRDLDSYNSKIYIDILRKAGDMQAVNYWTQKAQESEKTIKLANNNYPQKGSQFTTNRSQYNSDIASARAEGWYESKKRRKATLS